MCQARHHQLIGGDRSPLEPARGAAPLACSALRHPLRRRRAACLEAQATLSKPWLGGAVQPQSSLE
jgi:hypothetical protein